jgi:ABC-type transport system involved in Fe-S cluster assembly fused permease/ATPase subunit
VLKGRLTLDVATLSELFSLIWRDATSFVRARLAGVLLLVISASILTAMGPLPLKLVVDGFAGGKRISAISPAGLVVLYVLSQFLARAAVEVRGLIFARVQIRMLRSISERLFAHLMSLPLRFHLDRRTGAVSQALGNGLQGYEMIMHHVIFSFLPVVAELGTIMVVLTRLADPMFLVLFCAAFISYALAFLYSAGTIVGAAQRAAAAHVDANSTMVDGLLCIEPVKYFAAETTVQDRVHGALIRTENEWVAFYRRYAVNGLAVATIFAAFLAATVLYATHEVQSSRMTIGDFVLVNTYILQLVRPIETLGYAMQGLSHGTAMLRKLLELFREQAELQVINGKAHGRHGPRPGGQDELARHSQHGGRGRLEFDGVSLSYDSGRPVLSNVSFVVPAGRTLGIVGASGSGKSSIVRLVARLFEPSSGRILLDGVPLAQIPLQTLRQWVTVVPQDSVLFNDTISYNIGFGTTDGAGGDVEEAAKVAHLHDFIMSLPHRYETVVGERGVKLSGGEKQRVAIARAVLRRPRVFVFDEATSSLDAQTERVIQQKVRDISRHCTTLLIAHRLPTVSEADEIIVLEGGSIVERGTHDNLLRQKGRYAALWHAQQGSTAA